VQALIFINLFYAMWYAALRPEKILNTKYRLELLNEFAVICLSYCMMTFTSFVLHKSAAFLMGYAFVSIVAMILLVNIVFMLKGQNRKYLLKKKQEANQVAYINRFSDYSSIERLSFILRLDKNSKRIENTFN
jgi:uncharacterized membrane protein